MKQSQRLSILLLLPSLLAPPVLADDGARKLTGIERQTVAESAAWGAINTLSDGSLGLIVQRARPLEEIDAVNVSMEWLRSTDNGETWGDPTIIMAKSDPLPWEETALCKVGDTLLAHMRTGRHDVEQFRSVDGGRTWTGPTPVTEAGQQPGGAFKLASGNLLFTWGNRRAPFGATAMLSRDNGEAWDYDRRVALAWDAPNANCGYANGAQAADGTIVVTYYRMAESEDYRGLWTGSQVYVLRFTEEQLLEAMDSKTSN